MGAWASALVLGWALFLEPAPGAAQREHVLLNQTVSVELTTDEILELGTIETQSDWATAIYIASITSWVGALGLVVGAVPAAMANEGALCPMLASAAGLAFVGLVTAPIAVGLDVDAGSRRRGLQRSIELRVSAAGLSLTGSF